jgi:ferredoxin
VANPDGLVESFPIAQAIHDCDGLINLPKMKTHQLTRITGAVKNLFGCVPGKRKALYHVQFPDVNDFSRLLGELGLCLRPRLHVMDGVVAMQGNGPRSGSARPMRVLILSEDPVAVDATFCRLVAIDPTYVPTIVASHDLGLGRFRSTDIEYVGDELRRLVDPDFQLVRKPVYRNASYAHYPLIKKALLPRPEIDGHRCVRCGVCIDACPVSGKALRFDNGRRSPPVYDHERCIRCYCCQEMCPHQAIRTRTPLLGRILQLVH